MDAKDLKARIDAGRAFTHSLGGITFGLMRPTPQQIRQAMGEAKDDPRIAAPALLRRSITGWQGLKASHLDPEAGEDPVEFTPEALDLFLAEHASGWADELYLELLRRAAERREVLERARGN